MIKFFRKIRQKLLTENKFGKYLTYAIGEIVLVVIGILIALQINNWNEERKQTIEERETLKNIKSDFENTIIEFEENNNFRKRIISTTKVFYNLIHIEQNDYSNRQLDSLMANLFINPTYNGQSETLNILFNSGKINIISNDSIKNALVLWPQQVEDMTEDEIYSSNIIYKDLYPLLKRYVSIYNINNSINYKGLTLFNNPTQSTTPIDYNGLFKDREFEGTLSSRELPLSVSLIQTNELIEIAKKIIRLIEDEISDKK